LTYYATFIPGLQEFIAVAIRERLPDVSILKLLDGAVIFKTGVTYDSLNFFCFNNIFALIDIDEIRDKKAKCDIDEIHKYNGQAKIELHIKKIINALDNRSLEAMQVISENNNKIQSFRLVCSAENKPVSISEKSRLGMEKFIERISSLKPDRSNPDTEFWFLYRSEGFCVFMKRLTNNRAGEKSLHPGELSPQLAWSLCRIAELKHGQTASDPFCGYGSIPLAACRHFPVKKFYASDLDPACVKIAKSKPGLKNERCEIVKADFRSVPELIGQGSIDVIVTDPPWGLYKETDVPLQRLYDEIIGCFARLLKAGGTAVILSAAEKEVEAAVGKVGMLTINGKIPVLVSGKKAIIFKLGKV